jgi:hypothetical protein
MVPCAAMAANSPVIEAGIFPPAKAASSTGVRSW